MLRLFANSTLQAGTLMCALTLGGSLCAQSSMNTQSKPVRSSSKTMKAWVLINNGSANVLKPGSDAQTVEAVKTFAQRCPEVGVTLEKDKADFTILVGHDPHRPWWRRDNKIAVFDRSGSEIYSTSTRTMGNAVKDACQIITKNFLQVQSSLGTSNGNSD